MDPHSTVEKAKQIVEPYSSCDISDALCAFAISESSFFLPHSLLDMKAIDDKMSNTRICGLAYTAEFILNDPFSVSLAGMVKPVVNHVDTCPPGSILIIKTPSNAPNAVWGGLMTARAKAVGCTGVITDGRVRDVSEIKEFGFPVWCKGKYIISVSTRITQLTFLVPI